MRLCGGNDLLIRPASDFQVWKQKEVARGQIWRIEWTLTLAVLAPSDGEAKYLSDKLCCGIFKLFKYK